MIEAVRRLRSISVRGRSLLKLQIWLFLCPLICGLQSCARIDSQQRGYCEAIIPYLEPVDARITLTNETEWTNPDPQIRIDYRVDRPPRPDRARLIEQHVEICQFAGEGLSQQRLMLQMVETSHGALSESQLIFLNKGLFNDIEALQFGERHLLREGAARVRGFVDLDLDGGYFLQQLVNSAPKAALYALIALAYSLVYGLTNRINLAFGGIATIGSFGALMGVLLALALGWLNLALALPLGLVCAAALAGGSGGAIGRIVFLPLLARGPQVLLITTVGLALVIEEFLARAEGVHERWLPPILADPRSIAGGPFPVVITTMQILVATGAAALILAIIVGLRYTHLGQIWRAVADDRRMAQLLGINIDRVVIVSFAVASGLAGIGGSILTLQYGGTSFSGAATLGLKALVAAIIGGIGSVAGAVIGGVTLALVEVFWSAYEPLIWRDAVAYILMIVFLILRPDGILGVRRALEETAERP